MARRLILIGGLVFRRIFPTLAPYAGRPNLSLKVRQKVQKALADGHSIREVAKITGVSSASVGRIKRAMTTVEDRQGSVPA
ncbi:helix-turn-helix domain-containing protein [uncultured Brevundimonas sp.]|uniref:helix-turn-helix domain-containing protein n=1 Tax=uncultured Brevundimonas sp. TaxID=213418 RepID=UPI0025DA8A6E|nr:helix-turn-helix domain-containing protein [uncultured Brevundimonas sp.]